MLHWPGKRRGVIRILLDPCLQHVQVVPPMQWALLTRDRVYQITSMLAQDAIKSEVGNLADGRERLVHVSDLKTDLLALLTPRCHHQASPFSKVRYGLPVRDLILDTLYLLL